jgi:hypothetical protein
MGNDEDMQAAAPSPAVAPVHPGKMEERWPLMTPDAGRGERTMISRL